MEATTVANNGAVSISIEMSNAGSASYNNEDVTASSSPNNQELNFELLDSLYFDAADGDIKKFEEHSQSLDQILTPNGNNILHIHITARPRRIFNQERTLDLEENDFVRNMLGMCPALLRNANNKGETLLHMAARHGHADVAKFLLHECKQDYDQEHGITAKEMLQTINEAKDTALHEAVRYNHLDVVRILTKEDPTLPYDANIAGETPLYLAAERGYEEVLRKILDTCISPADHGPYSRTALHTAVIHKDEGIISLLLDDMKIQKSKQDQNGWTPLHFAAHLGDVEILKKLLIEDKSAAYKVDNKGQTALHIAAGLGKVNIMRELIHNCPGCCELVDKRGWNVLHFASTSKNRKAIRLIVQNPLLFGNLINEKDETGNTPFLRANSMRIIIDHPKVDTLVFDNDNRNIVDINTGKPTLWKWPEYFRWRRIHNKIGKGGRIMLKDEDEEEKENSSNPVSGKSNNGNGKSEDRSRDDLFRNARQNELMTATLIATVTFAAGLTVPGGFFSEKGPDQGTAILTRNKAFKAFVILNSISMFLSSLAVFTHLSSWPYDVYMTGRRKMRLGTFLIRNAMTAMIGAFLTGTIAVLYRDLNLAISSCLVPVAIFALLGLFNSKEFLLKTYFKFSQTSNKI